MTLQAPLTSVKPHKLEKFGELCYDRAPEGIGASETHYRVWYRLVLDPGIKPHEDREPGLLASVIKRVFHEVEPTVVSAGEEYLIPEVFGSPLRSPSGLLRHRLRWLSHELQISLDWAVMNEEIDALL